jgi:hypothetical protein
MSEETKKKTIIIVLKRLAGFTKDRKGKLIEQIEPDSKSLRCIQDDTYGLQQLLFKFDTRKHGMKEWKQKVNILDKLIEIYKKIDETKAEQMDLELSLDEASFLKSYLDEIPEKEGKEVQLQEFEIRTLVSVLEQLK